MNDLTGMIFGRLTVIALNGFTPDRSAIWLCHCSCGNFRFFPGKRITGGGKVRSCGCLQREVARRTMTTHGETDTRIYRIFSGIKGRCADLKNMKYGGRGISVCEEWKDFLTFKAWAISSGYSDSLTIERIDNDAGYNPSNCRWATITEQANNRRSSVFIEYMGERKTVAEWGRETGIPEYKIRRRVFRDKWNVDRALTQKGAA